MTALSTLVMSMLLLPLAAQAHDFSRQEADWTQADRASRSQKSQQRYRNKAGVQNSKVIFNHDGSITFKEPRLVRGPKLLPLSSAYSDNGGICHLFGLDNYVEESREDVVMAGAKAAIGSDGKFMNSETYGNAVNSISCAYDREYYQSAVFEKVFENPDGSITLVRPALIRADKLIALSSAYSDNEGICRLFRFDSYLAESRKDVVLAGRKAAIGSDGMFLNSETYGNAVAEITCYMDGDYQQTGYASKMSRNLDNSVTITNPVVIRGLEAKPVSAAYSDNDGVCRLFGFRSYLEESRADIVKAGLKAAVGSNGVFLNSESYGNAVQSITCYNGRYRTTAIAGGYLFQNGEWLGKIRKSRSRWNQAKRDAAQMTAPGESVAPVTTTPEPMPAPSPFLR